MKELGKSFFVYGLCDIAPLGEKILVPSSCILTFVSYRIVAREPMSESSQGIFPLTKSFF